MGTDKSKVTFHQWSHMTNVLDWLLWAVNDEGWLKGGLRFSDVQQTHAHTEGGETERNDARHGFRGRQIAIAAQ